MSARDRFFEVLQRAIARGFSVTAVAMSCGSPVRPDVRDVNGQSLAQSAEVGCSGPGPHDDTCCTNVHCYQPADGVCASVDSVVTRAPFDGVPLSPPLPPGSGTCLCGSPAVAGPFAQTDGGSTECCYVARSIGCTGRPLRDGETAIVASLVVRSDWA